MAMLGNVSKHRFATKSSPVVEIPIKKTRSTSVVVLATRRELFVAEASQ